MSSNKDSNKEYTLLFQDEDKGLLQSTNQQEITHGLSRISSMTDQPIEVSASNLDDFLPKKQGLQSSSIEISKLDDQCLKKNNNQINQPKQIAALLKKVNDYLNQFKELFRFKRQYVNLRDLYFQIAFDSLSVFYLIQNLSKLNQQRQQSFKDERLIKECESILSKNQASFYLKAQQDQNVVCKGYSYDYQAVEHINKKTNYRIYDQEYNNTFTLTIGDNQGSIQSELDKNFNFENVSSVHNSGNKLNLLSSATASVITLFTKYIFKSKITFTDFKSGQNYYFFGKKILLSNGEYGLKVKKIFNGFDYQKFKIDQAAYLISMLIASGIGIYMAVKLVRNVMILSKKKKLLK